MLCGCIDIGSNTTRVLVAEANDGQLVEVLQRRAFTRIGKGLKPGAEIPRAKIEEVAAVVASHRELAEEAGAHPVRTVATAAIRSAANRDEFVEVVSERGGVEVSILEGEEEARLAFLGATRTLGHRLEGRVGVVDVGGGSTEIAVGTVEGGVSWWASFRLGSGHLADEHLRSDPPSAAPPRRSGGWSGPSWRTRRSSAGSACCRAPPSRRWRSASSSTPSACGCCRPGSWSSRHSRTFSSFRCG